MNTASGIGKRIKAVRNRFALKQGEFAGKIGLSGNRLSEIEHEKGGMKASVLLAVCREFGISPEWLMNGEGEMLKESAATVNAGTGTIGTRLDQLEAQVRSIMQPVRTTGENVTSIPLFLGCVVAGNPDPATGEIEDFIDIPSSWAHGKKQVFALRVSGESMTGIGIMPGDMLIVESKQRAKDRQVVIASINGEMTVKTLSIEKGGSVLLLPANPSYKPIPVTAEMDFRIHGVVLAAVRSY
ncbi:MAG: helix-turn-helix domain-containing protein [Chlorobi bacterium]|nr:helix-turn-helix domain-containing protein [Chlorobiota bacterium]